MSAIKKMIEACGRQERKYQQIIYERFRGYALKIVFRYIYKYEEAADVVNDGFVKVFTHINNFHCEKEEDAEKMFMGWIRKIMINSAIDVLRRKSFLPEIGGIPDTVWDIKDDSANADQQILFADLIRMIKRLPPVYRTVFNMYVIDGYSHSEIAATLGMSVGTSKSGLSRARTLLRGYLKEMENEAACIM